MAARSVEMLSYLLANFLESLFKRIDDELVPKFYPVSFEMSKDHIQMSFHSSQVSIPTSIPEIKHLFERKSYLKDLIETYIGKSFYENSGLFFSDFFLYDQSIFTYAFSFDRKILDSYYRMTETAGVREKSIIDAIISETQHYLSQCSINFINNREIPQRSIDDLLKDAGKVLLSSILDNDTVDNPFDKICKISSLSYEKAFSNGRILLMSPESIESIEENPDFKLLLTFHVQIPLSSYRHIRKILELSKEDVLLLSDGEYIYSIIQFNNTDYHLDPSKHYFIVEFNSYYSWQLNHNANKLMQVTHEEVFIPKPKISYFGFSSEFKRVFEGIETKRILNLYKIILEASNQVKGTIIVISRNARSEAFRLKNQGFIINPTVLNATTVKSITSIDGAVLVDTDGVCHGIGVILDGVATEKGDPSRGARYNSAIRYVETIANNQNYSDCLTIVISEDGDVDIISKYSLRISY